MEPTNSPKTCTLSMFCGASKDLQRPPQGQREVGATVNTASQSRRRLHLGAGRLRSIASLAPGLLVAAALLWTGLSTLSVYPHQLAYFNEAAGGPENGHQHLLGSNLDWGQNVLYLKQRIADRPGRVTVPVCA